MKLKCIKTLRSLATNRVAFELGREYPVKDKFLTDESGALHYLTDDCLIYFKEI